MPKITQEMIKLYDDYTHLTLDRRDFMQKLKTADRLGGGRRGDRADACRQRRRRAAIVPEDDARLKTETITWPGAEGRR